MARERDQGWWQWFGGKGGQGEGALRYWICNRHKRDDAGDIRGVLDVDAATLDAFTSVDVGGLERIAAMIYAG